MRGDGSHLRDGHRWGRSFAVWCGGLSAFQAALALGAPWGEASWGGTHSGALPPRFRVASAVAAPALAALGAVSAGHLLGAAGRRRVLAGATAYVASGIVLNGISRSPLERAIWTPLTALGTGLAYRAWREAADR